MSDAPILAPPSHVTDLEAASDFEKKHTPYLASDISDGKRRISVELGHYFPHPNTPDHYFQWIEVLANGNPIARFDLCPIATDPQVSVYVNLDDGTRVTALAYCNLHGLWISEITV